MNVGQDEDTSEEQVLAKHVEILLTQSAPRAWIQATIDRLRNIVSKKDSELVPISSLATDVLDASAKAREVAREQLQKIESSSLALSSSDRAQIALLLLIAKSRLGLLPEATSLEDTLREAEDHLDEMAQAGALDPDDPIQSSEAWRMLLQIALHYPVRDAATETLITDIVETLIKSDGEQEINDQILLQILVADFARLSRSSSAKIQIEAIANAAMRVARLASSKRWPTIKMNYLASQMAAMEALEPKRHDRLLAGYHDLGNEMRVFGARDNAPIMFQRAITNADALLTDNAIDPTDKKRVAAARLVLLNNLGHALIVTEKFSDALAPLKLAREGRLAEHDGQKMCDRNRRGDAELATVNQNLADVALALGQFKEALDYARQARKCRMELDLKTKVIESTKTEGYALIYNGDQEAGKALLQKYVTAARQMFDTQILPDNPFFNGAIVAGHFVALQQHTELPETGSTSVSIPEAR